MADDAKINAAVAECLAAIVHSSDPRATISEFCATLAAEGNWTVAELAIVQMRVRQRLYPPG